MRPSYKPIKRRESKAFALRRQTIKHKKQDEDTFNETIENIDDYWKVASQKLAADSTLIEEEYKSTDKAFFSEDEDKNETKEIPSTNFSETLLEEKKTCEAQKNDTKKVTLDKANLRKKSFKEEFEKEVQKVNVSGISDSMDCEKYVENNLQMNSEKLGEIENIINDENFDNSDFEPEYFSDSETKENINTKNKAKEKEMAKSNTKKLQKVKTPKLETEINKKESIKLDFDKMKLFDKQAIAKEKKHTKDSKKMVSNASKNDSSSFIKNQNYYSYIPNIEKIERNKNQMNFLIETDAIETGIIFLNDKAFVEEITADKSFSLLVLKGAVNVKIEDETFCLKKHGMTVVKKDQIYAIQGVEGYASSIFISYSLK